MKGPWGYELAPDAIEQKSFEIIGGLVALSGFSPAEAALVKRVVHATGDPSFASILAWSPGAVDVGAGALAGGVR